MPLDDAVGIVVKQAPAYGRAPHDNRFIDDAFQCPRHARHISAQAETCHASGGRAEKCLMI